MSFVHKLPSWGRVLTSNLSRFQVDDESGFISSFNKLPETDAVRIFERSDFYTVHGQDALFVAQTVSLQYTIILLEAVCD